MTYHPQYVHTNLVADDWRRLAQFYQQVFGCTPVPPERDLRGQWLERCTGVADAAIRGIHLRLPGYGDNGPTLEVFQYSHQAERPPIAANRPGFGHIAFAVGDVQAARDAVLVQGGGELGQVVTRDVPGAGQITVVYVTDPEGNIIELQHWSAQEPAGSVRRKNLPVK